MSTFMRSYLKSSGGDRAAIRGGFGGRGGGGGRPGGPTGKGLAGGPTGKGLAGGPTGWISWYRWCNICPPIPDQNPSLLSPRGESNRSGGLSLRDMLSLGAWRMGLGCSRKFLPPPSSSSPSSPKGGRTKSSRNKPQMAPNKKVSFHEKLGMRSNTPGKSLAFDRKSLTS